MSTGMFLLSRGPLTGNDDLGHESILLEWLAAKDNSIGILGVAPGAKLWAIKVCDVNGNCPLSSQIKGIQYVMNIQMR